LFDVENYFHICFLGCALGFSALHFLALYFACGQVEASVLAMYCLDLLGKINVLVAAITSMTTASSVPVVNGGSSPIHAST